VRHGPSGFTVIELLVVVALLALLLGLLAPALWGARLRGMALKGGANLKELAAAMTAYEQDHDRHLPQIRILPTGVEGEGPTSAIFEWMFVGERSAAQVFGADGFGADRRPLNSYLGRFNPDDEVEVARDPLDNGTRRSSTLALAPRAQPEERATMHQLLGTSYIMNYHGLDRIPCPFVDIFPTLIPPEGGRMPMAATPSRTWFVSQMTIYNFDDGGDARMRWAPGAGEQTEFATMAFIDGHVELLNPVPGTLENTTPDYTFLPTPRWMERFEHLDGAAGR